MNFTDRDVPQLTQGIITIAYGRKFVEMAKKLAESAIIHAPSVLRAIVTDSYKDFAVKSLFDFVIPYDNSFGNPFEQKLLLPRYSPFQHTIYIDSDALVLGDLQHIFTTFAGAAVGFVGYKRKSGSWYLWDIAQKCEELNIDSFPVLNSGMLYFEEGVNSRELFAESLSMYHRLGEMGVPYFRGNWYPDEPALGYVFAKNEVVPVNDYGRFMQTLVHRRGRVRLNVLRGICEYRKHGRTVRPTIIHFAGKKAHLYHKREMTRIKLRNKILIPGWLVDGISNAVFFFAYMHYRVQKSRLYKKLFRRARS